MPWLNAQSYLGRGFLAVTLAGCLEATNPVDKVRGVYELVSVDGVPLPVTPSPWGNSDTRLLSGHVEIREWGWRAEYTQDNAPAILDSTPSFGGFEILVDGTEISLRPITLEPWLGTVTATTLTLQQGHHVFSYHKQ